MAEDYDKLISQKQADLESLKSRMEEVRQQFIQDSVEFVGEWYEKTAEAYVKKDADRTLDLGREKLGQLKTKVLKLKEDAEAIADEVLSDPQLWWHLAERDSLSYARYGRGETDELAKAIRLALGRLGPILEEFGYVKTKSADPQDHQVWCEWDESGHYHPPDGRPCYPSGVSWTEAMQNTIKRYGEMYSRGKAISQETDGLRREKKEHQVQNLWDSI